MKEGLKKTLRAFAALTAAEIVVCLFAGTLAWAIAEHDIDVLDLSFYGSVRTDVYAKVVGVIMAAIVLVNLVVGPIYALKQGKSVKRAALAATIMTGFTAPLFFLPMRFTVYGFGGVIGLFVAYKLLRLLWSALTWLPKKIFRRAPKDAKATQAAAASKPPKKTS